MKGSGLTICSMGMEKKCGETTRNMRVNTRTPKNMERGPFFLLMDLSTRENFSPMTFMGMVPIVGQMEEFMKVNGTKIKCMEKD